MNSEPMDVKEATKDRKLEIKDKKREKEYNPNIYARLPLLSHIQLANGATSGELVVYRPTCKTMAEVVGVSNSGFQVLVSRFVDGCVRAVNGSGDPLPETPLNFATNELCLTDAVEIASIIQSFTEESERIEFDEAKTGDGINNPLVYTLQRPIVDGEEIVKQIQFEAKKLGEISEFLDARDEIAEFHAFCSLFGKPLGASFPLLTTTFINAMDCLDYLMIKRRVMPRFTLSRGRWKRPSSREH